MQKREMLARIFKNVVIGFGVIRSLRNCNLTGPIPDLSKIPKLLYL